MNAPQLANKSMDILHVLENQEVDTWKLRELALTEGGFVTDLPHESSMNLVDELRKQSWPLLVRAGSADEAQKTTGSLMESSNAQSNSPIVVPCSDDFEIIEWDVLRSWHLLDHTEREQKNFLEHTRDRSVTARIKSKQRGLVDLINTLLVQGASDFHYFQGFHELASVFLNVLCELDEAAITSKESKEAGTVDLNLPIAVLSQVSHSHLMDMFKGDFSHLETALQLSLFPLIAKYDPELHEYLHDCSIQPSFAVSWIITWFSHDIHDSDLVKRLFDFFLASHPLMPVYVAVAMITHPYNRLRVLESECEYSHVYSVLRGLPKNSISTAGWNNHFESMDDDPFAESDGSTASESGFSVESPSRTLSTLEKVFHDIVEETESQLNDDTDDMEDSTSTCSDTELVPFEDILSLALEYIRHVPPGQLLTLASKYYGAQVSRQLLSGVNKISMFTAPSWVIPPYPGLWKKHENYYLALTAHGLGQQVGKNIIRTARRKCFVLSALASLIFILTMHCALRNLFSLWEPQSKTMTRCDLEPEQELVASAGEEANNRINDVTELVHSASRIVIDNAVSIYLRAYATDLFAFEGYNRDDKLGSSRPCYDSDSLLDLDATQDVDTINDNWNSMRKSLEKQLLVNNPCLSNETTLANALLSRGGRMSNSHCLVSWMLSEWSSGRTEGGGPSLP